MTAVERACSSGKAIAQADAATGSSRAHSPEIPITAIDGKLGPSRRAASSGARLATVLTTLVSKLS